LFCIDLEIEGKFEIHREEFVAMCHFEK
jgi:hypothetical protein